MPGGYLAATETADPIEVAGVVLIAGTVAATEIPDVFLALKDADPPNIVLPHTRRIGPRNYAFAGGRIGSRSLLYSRPRVGPRTLKD